MLLFVVYVRCYCFFIQQIYFAFNERIVYMSHKLGDILMNFALYFDFLYCR